MSDPITQRVAQILAQSGEGLMPLEEIYQMLANEGLMAWFDFETFVALIASDERFEVVEGLGDSGLLDDALRRKLGLEGLFGGPRVVLRGQQVTPEVVMQDLLRQLREMNDVLETVWSRHAPDDPVAEAELINLMILGDLLERELHQVLRAEELLQEMEKRLERLGRRRRSESVSVDEVDHFREADD